MAAIERWSDLIGRYLFSEPFKTIDPFEPWQGGIGGSTFKAPHAEVLTRTVGDPPDMRKVAKILLEQLHIDYSRLQQMNWPEIVKAMELVPEKARDKKEKAKPGQSNRTGKRLDRRRKTPPQFLKEARERHVAKLLAKDAKTTCYEIAKVLACAVSTVTRLEAWKNRGVLDYAKPTDRSEPE